MKVDFLRIDGQFIRGLMHDEMEAAAMRCFVDVGRIVGTQIVAEFVEVAALLPLLQNMGVNYAQGYFVHHPAPLETLDTFLHAACDVKLHHA